MYRARDFRWAGSSYRMSDGLVRFFAARFPLLQPLDRFEGGIRLGWLGGGKEYGMERCARNGG